MLFVALLPSAGLAQLSLDAEETRFYQDLAINDAKHEQTLPAIGAEDEADFWRDQKAFEALLQANSPEAYQVYINAKSAVYRQHQLGCGEAYCDHSEAFIRQASFYIVNGAEDSGMAFADKKKTTTPKK